MAVDDGNIGSAQRTALVPRIVDRVIGHPAFVAVYQDLTENVGFHRARDDVAHVEGRGAYGGPFELSNAHRVRVHPRIERDVFLEHCEFDIDFHLFQGIVQDSIAVPIHEGQSIADLVERVESAVARAITGDGIAISIDRLAIGIHQWPAV